MFESTLERLQVATTLEEVSSSLKAYGTSIGCPWFALLTVTPDEHGQEAFRSLDHLSPGHNDLYDDPALGRPDPVMQFVKRSPMPIAWDGQTYFSAPRGGESLYEELTGVDVRTGFLMAQHLPNGNHVLLGFNSPDHKLPERRDQLMIKCQLGALIGTVSDTALTLIGGTGSRPTPHLTCKEKELLKWLTTGKTSWEISQIMAIAEGVINNMTAALRQKLNATNKSHLVFKAIRLNLV